MSVCDITPVVAPTIPQHNQWQTWALGVSGAVELVIAQQEKAVADLQGAIIIVQSWSKQHISPLDPPWVVLAKEAWNVALEILRLQLGQLQQHIHDVQEQAHACGQKVANVLEKIGNPDALLAMASALREISGTTSQLADGVSLTELAADNSWHGSAASAYAERAGEQRDNGLDDLADKLEALAEALEGNAIDQAEFWDKASGIVIDAVIALVGLLVTLAGLAATFIGLAATPATAGISLVVTVIGLVASLIGLLTCVLGVWRVYTALEDLMTGADAGLVERSDQLSADVLTDAKPWPLMVP